MNDILQQHPYMPEVKNPALSTENFNRHWDQAKYANFRARVNSHAQTAKSAQADPSSEAAANSWKKLFGESFGRGSTGGGGAGSSPRAPGGKAAGYVAPATGIPVVRRPNEARRFG